MPRLVLASASPARTKLLSDAGIRHTVRVSEVDEDAVTAQAGVTTPSEIALLLARAKAEAVAGLAESRDALVLGCDSVFEFEGEAYGKPWEPEVAKLRISNMSGRSGVLHTGHWLVDNRDGGASGAGATGNGALASATVSFATLSEDEIDAYVASGEPLQVAGSFTIDSLGGAFITSVNGDPHAVVGLSVSTLRELLSQRGVGITELWQLKRPETP
ncbi:Maf family protein [Psychromicrobium lacuslunae]|uniref:Nucleoside triphosphate pyrophosphatase n=1 Tax=Psychromicrobium lacuslunae TaxID=1618207 RepID=A0A0D4C2C7_9MICC|nr:nucleoside triphosphate pyrophosphatase [Psychromicrobium lacuslunae]AJT42758.1 septum formation inhibitor Maf [Psychromicrobium lacuslunae]